MSSSSQLQLNTMQPFPATLTPIFHPPITLLCTGPLGQCHPIPDDAQLKTQMRTHARNAAKIHSAYNIPYEVQPGSDLDKAIKLHEQKQARKAEYDVDENEAEQRRLERFARLQQKRRGGMRVCCWPRISCSTLSGGLDAGFHWLKRCFPFGSGLCQNY